MAKRTIKRYVSATVAANALRQVAGDLESRGGEMRWYLTVGFEPVGKGTIRTVSLGFQCPAEQKEDRGG